MKIFILTFGCKVNQHESQQTANQLLSLGHQVVGQVDEAELVIVNTCTVTQVADKKSRQMIRHVARHHPLAKIIITGCMPENPMTPIDVLSGSEIVLKGELAAYLSTLPSPQLLATSSTSQGRIRRTLLIQTGCDYYCSYCIIPTVRHGRVSFPQNKILHDFKLLVSEGVKEIVLTGINLGTWQEDDRNVSDLVETLLDVNGDFRIRLGSLEPNLVNEKLLALMGDHPRLATHLHVPLQGAANTLLKRMNRRYSLEDYLALCDKVAAAKRPIQLTTDLIIGYPEETDAEFEGALNLIETGLFLDVHAFAYSVRQGTVAASKPQLAPSLVRERMKRILVAIEDAKKKALRAMQGKRATILVETIQEGQATGYTEGYVKVMIEATGITKNRFVEVVFGAPLLIGKEWGLKGTV